MYFLLLLGGRDDTSKSVIVTLSNLWEGATAPPLPPARYSPVSGCVAFPGVQGNVTLGKF